MNPLYLKSLPEPAAVDALGRLGATPPEARRIWSAAVKRRIPLEALAGVPQVRRTVLDAVAAEARLDRLPVTARHVDPVDGFTKYLFTLPDGHPVEAVRIPIFDSHYVVCVSSQVGCPLACAFCATGRMGLKRNLAPWEMVEQVLAIRDEADRPVRGVVFMGMGEPFLNYEAVVDAAQILTAGAGGAIGGERVSISTVGHVPGIRRYTREGHKWRLTVSLHAALPEKRAEVVPAERRWPLDEVMDAAREHALTRRRRVTLAYVMIRGFNTSPEDAEALKALIGDTPIILDLIDVNDATGRFLPPTPEELDRFRDALRVLGQPVVRRYSGGKAVEAACGMLAGPAASLASAG